MTFSVFGLPSQTFPKENRVSFRARKSSSPVPTSNSADSVIPQPHLLVLLHRLLRPMPTLVTASRISTWVFSTKIYTDKLIFVTKLGLWLVRVLLKENCLASRRKEAIDKDAIYRSG
ncbi:PREDICTED: PRUPE_7G205100 [Prunus dulcis]|uniref:PREDICTED: PRUPE_7G205100 n=1 Tax=Prunus dulcis TaxID=3755 RepID=A0A5E4E6G4_PRUDU|nr:PREDICTED: PRUPE_7G205100 [Prunus dulcis]